uniref:TLC domain-containing protein n=1 Tax=Ananas comosus var. bracteatus TaxID=296719 RepID=A0A6V7NWC8_ANACO|nr:unnamed protein product [Ananas comosus var. bracteatus]
MEDYVVNWVISGVVFWATTFIFVRNLFPKRSFDFCNRIVSTIHATTAVCLASLSVQSWSCPLCPLASKSSPAQMKALAVSLSYLIYDLICCMFGHHFNLDNFVHHTVSIVGIGAGLAYEMILFAVIFSLARMVVGPYLTYVTLSANYPLLIKAMALGLQLVSAFWFYKILRMVRHKLGKKMKANKTAKAEAEAEAANFDFVRRILTLVRAFPAFLASDPPRPCCDFFFPSSTLLHRLRQRLSHPLSPFSPFPSLYSFASSAASDDDTSPPTSAPRRSLRRRSLGAGVFSDVVAGAMAVGEKARILYHFFFFSFSLSLILLPLLPPARLEVPSRCQEPPRARRLPRQLAAPEPSGGYFVAIAVEGEAALVASDLRGEAYRRAVARSAPRGEALLISRREHVAMRRDVRSGVRLYATSALEETSARAGGLRQQRKKKKKRKKNGAKFS